MKTKNRQTINGRNQEMQTGNMNRTRIPVADVQVGDTVVTYTFEDGRIVPQTSVVTEIVEDNSDREVPHRWLWCADRDEPLHRSAWASIAVLASA